MEELLKRCGIEEGELYGILVQHYEFKLDDEELTADEEKEARRKLHALYDV
ncbi:hypothetical protein [Cytobacillus gottheilii]|uniref:hypothetical protein n=1 Tax=Cytobacillus gottheilii TaxID=859144 RepID=UPI001593A384|nr:hypothetical protein [Cytobacillus gottheilii]